MFIENNSIIHHDCSGGACDCEGLGANIISMQGDGYIKKGPVQVESQF